MIAIYCSGFCPALFLYGIGSTVPQFEFGGTTEREVNASLFCFYAVIYCDVEPTTFVVLLVLCMMVCAQAPPSFTIPQPSAMLYIVNYQ